MTEKLIRNEKEAIECLKKNKPTSGYYMLQESVDMAIQALEKQSMVNEILHELREYSAIGTIEEFKALKEKSVAKKPYILPINREEDFTYCPNCKTNGVLVTPSYVYCTKCGQKLDWSE